MNDEERDKKLEKIHKEYEKLWKDEGGDGGYFYDLWKKLGDNPATNIKSFKFKKEVLNAYNQEIPTQRFIIEKHIGCYLRDKLSMWDLKFYENENIVFAILVDLAHIPKNHQDWWYEHLI